MACTLAEPTDDRASRGRGNLTRLVFLNQVLRGGEDGNVAAYLDQIWTEQIADEFGLGVTVVLKLGREVRGRAGREEEAATASAGAASVSGAVTGRRQYRTRA